MLAGIAFVLVLLLAARPVSIAARTILFLPSAFSDALTHPLEALTPPPVREAVTFPFQNTQVPADLYRPGAPGKYGAVIFLLGVNPLDKRDPIVVRLSEGLARSGIVVLLPEFQNLLEGRVTPSEVEGLVEAFQYLQGQPFVDKRRVGFAGFSVGASLSLLAASDDRIADQVAFVNAFGGYFSVADLIEATLTQRMRFDHMEEDWSPQEQVRHVLARQLIESLPSEEDRLVLSATYLDEGKAEGNRLGLSSEGQKIAALLEARDRATVQRLISQLPEATNSTLRRLSPEGQIAGLRAQLFIMHDREDTLIPYVESRRLAAAAPDKSRVVFTEFSLFEHVVPNKPLDLPSFARELMKLFWHLYRVMLVLL